MKLIVDEGNSLVKVAVFNTANEILLVKSTKNWEVELNTILAAYTIEKAIVSSVGALQKEIISYLEKQKISFKLIRNISDTRLMTTYLTPETLGVDRVANAAYCYHQKKYPALVIDCGTCLKFDFVDESGVYLGGAISPGLKMRMKAMHVFTEKLPEVLPSKNELNLIGNSTESSLLSGAQLGILHEIKQTIVSYNREFRKLNIFITGGDADYFVKALKNNIFADPFLTLKGLNEILNHS